MSDLERAPTSESIEEKEDDAKSDAGTERRDSVTESHRSRPRSPGRSAKLDALEVSEVKGRKRSRSVWCTLRQQCWILIVYSKKARRVNDRRRKGAQVAYAHVGLE